MGGGRRLSDVGEFGLIERIGRLVGRAQPGDRWVTLGIGDDAALVRPRPGQELAVTTDALVQGVHFRFDQESPRTAGRRAMAAALSDLAAMGAAPLGFTLGLTAPRSLEVNAALGLVRGLLDLAREFACPLVGGNVARSRQVSLTLTALGSVARSRALRRDGARSGERILVTGTLGASGLERARGRVRRVPTPRLGAGAGLARSGWATACIDVSDGLLADLGHLCRASGVGARVAVDRVPQPRGFAAACRRAGQDPDALSLGAGEDYELLFTVGARAPGSGVLSRRLGVPVSEIGRVEPRGLRLTGSGSGKPVALGWRHF